MRIVLLVALIAISPSSWSTELGFGFKSPAFNGIGYSSHVQTIENTEFSRKKAIDDKRLQDAKDAAAAANNTMLQKFLTNFESRVYAQLSTQLINNLFGENPSDHGTITIEGNTIQYVKTDNDVTLTVTDPAGNVTTVTIPIGQFKF
jgi:hypothetical protein